MNSFRALVLHEEGGKVVPRLESLDESRLPPGDVTVRVEYSTLNYKDGMILQGQGRLVRQYPHVPGIDFAGTVERSASPEFKPGDPVILTGWRVGELHWGGYAERARVKADWLVHRPAGLSAKQAMAIGTAGFTAMLALIALERHGLKPDLGEVLVTGASGGVGGVAVSLLVGARLPGRRLDRAAGTARLSRKPRRRRTDRPRRARREADPPARPRALGRRDRRGRRQHAGDDPDAAQISRRRRRLRAGRRQRSAGQRHPVPAARRQPARHRFGHVPAGTSAIAAWDRLARDLPLDRLDRMTETVPLAEVPALAPRILNGAVRGRVVVAVGDS